MKRSSKFSIKKKINKKKKKKETTNTTEAHSQQQKNPYSQHHAATAASHRRSEKRLPPPPSRTSLLAIIGQNLLTLISHTLFSSCDLSLGCVACVRLAVGLIGFHLICLWVLFDLFVHFVWVCLYFLFVFSFVGL